MPSWFQQAEQSIDGAYHHAPPLSTRRPRSPEARRTKPDDSQNPDYRIDWAIYDYYAPSTGNVWNIAKTIETKVSSGQTSNLVVDLADSRLYPRDPA